MPSIDDVIKNYRTLSDFCDTFWLKVQAQYPGELLCQKGCHTCCELESVCALEAHIIRKYIDINHGGALNDAARKKACPLLAGGLCSIYQRRPIICRTHGLPIKSATLTNDNIDCCPMNFPHTDLQDIDPNYTLDLDMITDNLMRLNMAFCILLGDNQLAAGRFTLHDILEDNIPDPLKKQPAS